MSADAIEPDVSEDEGTGDRGPRPDEWVAVATVAELKRHRKKLVRVGGTNVALFWHKDRPFALQNTCIHKKRHLVKGTMLGDRIVCPGHQWAFNIETGYERTQDACQPSFETKVVDETVLVHTASRIAVEGCTWQPEQLNR